MSDICKRLEQLRSEIPEDVRIVAISKTKPVEAIAKAMECGQVDFGENKVQEMDEKREQLPPEIRWHMVGHVQTNKIKYMAPYVHMVQGVDREKVLRALDKEAGKNDRRIDCLLQVHIAEEESKFGFSEEELLPLLDGKIWKSLPHVRIRGLMGMATFTDDKQQIGREFGSLRKLYEKIGSSYPLESFDTLSMGMSGDYNIAIDEGSNMVRVGSAIFGARNQK